MQPLLRFAFVALLFVAALRADSSLLHVRHAQELLGAELWSRIIRVENTAADGRYPRELHALVFELAGVLWFYTPVDGTQSFSLHVDNLAAEKADFAPLLRGIDPGFRRWREVDAAGIAVSRRLPLPNGCFVESVAALRRQLATGAPMRNPRLLSYYVDLPTGLKGHTVLAFEQAGEITIVDPTPPKRRSRVPLRFGSDPLALARAFDGMRVTRARVVKLDAFAEGVRGTTADIAELSGAGVPTV